MIRLRPCSNSPKVTVDDQAKWVISSNRQLDGSPSVGLGERAAADSFRGHYHAFTVTLLRGDRDRKGKKTMTPIIPFSFNLSEWQEFPVNFILSFDLASCINKGIRTTKCFIFTVSK